MRQVDNGSTQSFSSVVVVAVAKAVAVPQLETYPNPAPDAQAVKVHFVNMPAGGGLVQTYSEMGQLVSQQPVGQVTTGLELPRLAPGLYHVVLRDAAGQRLATQRLIISGQQHTAGPLQKVPLAHCQRDFLFSVRLIGSRLGRPWPAALPTN
nr:T9SS type A sorting domain-containing protein [Hymenobacter siberiensis]